MIDQLQRIRQRMLLPAGVVALLGAGFAYGPLHNQLAFTVCFVGAVAVLVAMGVTLLLEMHYAAAETPEFSEVNTVSTRGDVS